MVFPVFGLSIWTPSAIESTVEADLIRHPVNLCENKFYILQGLLSAILVRYYKPLDSAIDNTHLNFKET